MSSMLTGLLHNWQETMATFIDSFGVGDPAVNAVRGADGGNMEMCCCSYTSCISYQLRHGQQSCSPCRQLVQEEEALTSCVFPTHAAASEIQLTWTMGGNVWRHGPLLCGGRYGCPRQFECDLSQGSLTSSSLAQPVWKHSTTLSG